MIDVGIIDDSKTIRLLVDICISDNPDIGLLWEYESFNMEVMKRSRSPHIIMLDIYLGNQNGLELIPSITNIFPDASILMITRSDETESIIDAIKRGASGYLMKDLIYTQLPFAIRILYKEQAYLCPRTSTALVNYLREEAR